jgi:hypothetical protein
VNDFLLLCERFVRRWELSCEEADERAHADHAGKPEMLVLSDAD